MNFLLKMLIILACSVIYFSCSEHKTDLTIQTNPTYTLTEKDGSSFVADFSLKGLVEAKPFFVTLSPEEELRIGDMLKRNFPKIELEFMHDLEVVIHPKEGGKDNGLTVSAIGVSPEGDNTPVAIHFGPSPNNDKSGSGAGPGGPGPYHDWTTHTCTGAPCSCCNFSRKGNGTVKGCSCSDSSYDLDCLKGLGEGSKCNHTVSE